MAIAIASGVLTLAAHAAEMSTPPMAARSANTFLTCAVQNTGGKAGTARAQIVEVPSGVVRKDSGEQSVAPGAGITIGAVADVSGPGAPDCTNGDCPCPYTGGTELCGHYGGAAYCRFLFKEGKSQYRAVGCVSAPAAAPASSPSCIEAR